MNLKFSCLFLLLLAVVGCRTNRTRNHMREGRWIEKFEIDSTKYSAKGRFRHDEEIKTWKHFANKKLHKKEVYENGFCLTTHYYPNGKVASIGKTKCVTEGNIRHWFYFGDWVFYDENGKIALIRHYENGELLYETPMN